MRTLRLKFPEERRVISRGSLMVYRIVQGWRPRLQFDLSGLIPAVRQQNWATKRRLSLLHWQRQFLSLCPWEAPGVVTSMVRKPLVELRGCCSRFKPLPPRPAAATAPTQLLKQDALLPSTPTILGSQALPGHWSPGHWNFPGMRPQPPDRNSQSSQAP